MRLLAITAHPDDESGSFGGTLALYAKRGHEVEIVCVTRGAAARNRGGIESPAALKEARAAEFRAACSVLGASWYDILDYPDGGLHGVPLNDLGVRLCAMIRERRPDIVVTIGPEGGFTGHADHGAVGAHATFGFHNAGRESRYPKAGRPHGAAKLYYQTGLGPLEGYARVTFSPVTAEIDIGETFETKLRAFQQHRTQAPLFDRFRAATERVGRREYFHLAASRVPIPPGIEHDLFAGI